MCADVGLLLATDSEVRGYKTPLKELRLSERHECSQFPDVVCSDGM